MDCSKFVRYEYRNKDFAKSLFGLELNKGYIHRWVSFNNFEDQETKIPEKYKKVKVSKDFIKKYYCDPSIQKLNKNNEFYIKIKKQFPTKCTKSYFTHDNGGRPFLVYIKDQQVSIYKKSNKYYFVEDENENEDNKNKWMYIHFIAKYKPLKIWIGRSPKNKITLGGGGFGKDFYGNSILLQITKNNYVFIGTSIFKFEHKNQIVKFVSPVGNSDVPYPFAIDNKNNCILFEEHIIIKDIPKKYSNDPYQFYYDNENQKNQNNQKKFSKLKHKIIEKREF